MPFGTTSLMGMNFAFPDVCLTPVGPAMAPIPYPNFHFTTLSIPSAYNVFASCGPVLTMMGSGLMSVGDNVGVSMGVASGMVASSQRYLLGCFTLLVSGGPAVNMSKMTMQNLTNTVGMNLLPSQFRSLFLKA